VWAVPFWYGAKKIGCNFLPYLHKDINRDVECVVPLRKENRVATRLLQQLVKTNANELSA
jgi:hypothetical protein